MNPAYQGQVDVLRRLRGDQRLRHMHATRLLACRNILHEALLDAARDEGFFRALLEQRTDCRGLGGRHARPSGKGRLALAARPFPAHFPGPEAPPPDELWDCMADWLHKDGRRAVLFQFVRVL
ncbi:MAG: hypothetical protein V8Q84_00535 [Bilophila sp.]